MLNIDVSIDSIKKLDKHIKYVERMLKMKTDVNFQKYIQQKCLETVKQVSYQRIGINTNEEYIEEYISRHQIREVSNGFVLYNDLAIPAILSTKSTKNQDRSQGIVRNYENGFSLALAFEYGTGLVGAENAVQGAWDYNVNNYGDKGWYYKPLNGNSIRTRGYQGFEIYRYTAEEIKSMLPKWVNDYLSRNEV
jgi:hypothetical protein